MYNNFVDLPLIKSLFSINATESSKDVAWQSTILKCFAFLSTLALTGAIYFSAISLSTGIIANALLILVVKVALACLRQKRYSQDIQVKHEGEAKPSVLEVKLTNIIESQEIIVFNSETSGAFQAIPQDLFNLIALRLNGPRNWQHLYSINQAFLVSMQAFAQELRKNGFIQLNKIAYFPFNFSDLHKAKSFSRAIFTIPDWLLKFKNDELVVDLNIRVAESGTEAERLEAIEWLKGQSDKIQLSLSYKRSLSCELDVKKKLKINFALGSIYSSSDLELSTIYYERGWILLRNEQLPDLQIVLSYYGKDLDKGVDKVNLYFNELLDANIATFEKFPVDERRNECNSYHKYVRYLLEITSAQDLPAYYEAKRESIKTLLLKKMRCDDNSDYLIYILNNKLNVILKGCSATNWYINNHMDVTSCLMWLEGGDIQRLVEKSVLFKFKLLSHQELIIPQEQFEEFREILLNSPVQCEKQKVVVLNPATPDPFQIIPQDLFNLVVLRLNGPQNWKHLYSVSQACLGKIRVFAQELRKNGFIKLNNISCYPYNFSDLDKAKSFSRNQFQKTDVLLQYANEELVADLNIRAAKSGTEAEKQEAIAWLQGQSRAKCLSPCNMDLKKLLMINFALGSIYSSSDPELSTFYYERGWTLLRGEQQPSVEVVMLFYGKDLDQDVNAVNLYFNELLDANIATFEKFQSSPSHMDGSYEVYCKYLLSIVDAEDLPSYYEEKQESIKSLLIRKVRRDVGIDLYKQIISCKLDIILKGCLIQVFYLNHRDGSTNIEGIDNQNIVQNSVLSRYLDHSPDNSSGEFILIVPSEKFEEFREILLNTPG